MFCVDDIRTPRDRISEGMMREMLECDSCPVQASPRMARQNAPMMPNCRLPEGTPLAMVYSPCQLWRGIYAPDMALRRGTMFKELDMPLEIQAKGGCSCGK